MKFYKIDKLDVATLLQIEFWLEKAMYSFDETGTRNLVGFIEGGLYGANEHIYQFMRSINTDYFLLNGGKRAFRKLPVLLRRGIFYSPEYREYQEFLEKESKRLNCEGADLEIDDTHLDYDHLKW